MTLRKKFPKSWIDQNSENLINVLDACQSIFDNLNSEIIKAKNGLSISSATGNYLDIQGGDFKTPRIPGESDSKYRGRILAEMLRLRNTTASILSTLADIRPTGNQVYEPWRNLFVIGSSELSGPDKIIDYNYWNYHVIDVLTRLQPDAVRPVLEKIISAGKELRITQIIELISNSKEFSNIHSYLSENQIDHIILDLGIGSSYLNLELSTDIITSSKRYLTMDSADIPIDSNYPFDDNVEIPYEQVSMKIKNEIQGVDY